MTWDAECRQYCQRVKYLGEQPTWGEKLQHAGWLKADAALLDENRVTIPHLVFSGEYAPVRRGGNVVRFSVMYASAGQRRRVFQLEVYPPHVRSHRDDSGDIYGTHIHYAKTVRKVLTNLDVSQTEQWMRRFVRHAKVIDNEPYRLQHPFETDLFSRQ